MAYAAVISLKQTINGLLNSYRASLVSSTREILEYAYNETTSLQKVVERLYEGSSERVDALEGQIRDCAHELEDVVELYESNQIYSDEGGSLRQEISSFAERVKKLEAEYIEEPSKPVVPEDDEDASVDFGVEMVGYSSEYPIIRSYFVQSMRPDDMCYFSFLGEAGSGGTVVAKAIFEELCCKGKQEMFDCWAWVTIGTKYEMKEVLIRILAQVDNLAGDYELLTLREDEKICWYLYKILKCRRYMIVLIDVPDAQVLDYLTRSFPKQSNGSLVFFTTSLREVVLTQSVNQVRLIQPGINVMEQTSWFLLRSAIFDEDTISPEMEEAGKRIAKNCGGLRISLAKTLLFLFKTEKTLEEWSRIAADKENPIFTVRDEISEVPYLPYSPFSVKFLRNRSGVYSQLP